MSLLLPRLKRLTILDNRGEIVRFTPNAGQLRLIQEVEDQFADRKRARVIVLKARQIGFSTAIEGLGYALCDIFDNYTGLVMAHDRDTAQSILTMTKRFWANDPFKPLRTLRTDSKADLEWSESGSQIKVATAGNREAGRGTTKRFIHQSEAAFYTDPKRTMNALRNAIHPVPSTFMAIESTANGVGNQFHTEWELATSGESDIKPLFFPWHHHDDYCASAIGISPTITTYDEDERVLNRLGISDDKLAWRRWKIRDIGGDLLQFHQEFPTDPEEAFLSTGQNVFPGDLLRDHYEPLGGYRGLLLEQGGGMKFVPSVDGSLLVYKAPSRDNDFGEYIIGADPTHTTRGDYAVATVLNRRTLEQVAMLRLRCDPVEFAKHLYRLGEYYHYAIIANETEGPGNLTVGVLNGMGYPNVYLRQSKLDKTPGKLTGEQWGWSTSLQTKHIAIGFVLNALSASSFLIHDATTYREMKSYVTLGNGGYGNGDGSENDDTVMAIAIALAAHFTDAPPLMYGGEARAQRQQLTSIDVGGEVTAAEFGRRNNLDIETTQSIMGLKDNTTADPESLYGEDKFFEESDQGEEW
jgi:hypothetical protein